MPACRYRRRIRVDGRHKQTPGKAGRLLVAI
jgi:hypothetical protein